MTSEDPFAEISKARFQDLGPELTGRRDMMFRYYRRSEERTLSAMSGAFRVGLWAVGGRAESDFHTLHEFPYLPNYEEVERLITGLGWEVRPSHAVHSFIGLSIGRIVTDSGVAITIKIGKQNLNDYQNLALDPATPLKEELEDRFGVLII